MPYKLVPRLLQTTIQSIEFARFDTESGVNLVGPVYHVELTVNGSPYSFEVQLLHTTGFRILGRPRVFGTLKYPDGAVAAVVRRFSEGEAFTFPIDLGDIGKG